MLSVRLDPETEEYLDELVYKMGSSSKSELIKTLIVERWAAAQDGLTFLERRGSHPVNLLNSGKRLSDRAVRKKEIAGYLEQKQKRQSVSKKGKGK